MRKQSEHPQVSRELRKVEIALIPPIMMSIKHYAGCLLPWHMGFVLLQRGLEIPRIHHIASLLSPGNLSKRPSRIRPHPSLFYAAAWLTLGMPHFSV